jgi:curved DNA-binding protein CbpA
LKHPNHYEFLQISPNAEPNTIHRVYRFLAMRFHPDNPETGDSDKFFELKQAYEVLSNSSRRAAYDAACNGETIEPDPLSSSVDFMDDIEGELNRRLAVLAVLYIRRRTNPESPEVSLHELEARMGFPREYLEFTIWYLQKKGYITRADNAAFALTADGVDFVETQRLSIPVLQKMLTSGSGLYSGGRRRTDPAPDHAAQPVTATQERRSGKDRRKRG